MEITERYTNRMGRQFVVRLRYNERIGDADPATQFVLNADVLDAQTREPIAVPAQTARFSTYENFQSFGGYAAINYFGSRQTAIEGLRTKVLTRIEDYLETVN